MSSSCGELLRVTSSHTADAHEPEATSQDITPLAPRWQRIAPVGCGIDPPWANDHALMEGGTAVGLVVTRGGWFQAA